MFVDRARILLQRRRSLRFARIRTRTGLLIARCVSILLLISMARSRVRVDRVLKQNSSLDSRIRLQHNVRI